LRTSARDTDFDQRVGSVNIHVDVHSMCLVVESESRRSSSQLTPEIQIGRCHVGFFVIVEYISMYLFINSVKFIMFNYQGSAYIVKR
jgi:hypothetical protein